MTDDNTFAPFGELALGGARIYRVVSGGLDVFIAERRGGGHGRAYALCERIGPDGETPYLPADDAEHAFYARAIPGTLLEPLGADEVRARAAAGVPAWVLAKLRLPREMCERTAKTVDTRRRIQGKLMRDAFGLFARLFRPAKNRDAFDPADPLASAARRAARLAGLANLTVAESRGGTDDFAACAASRLNRTADANHIRIVSCALAGEWWRGDFTPFLVLGRSDGRVWSVSAGAGGEAVAWDGATGEEIVVDAAFAGTLASVGWQFVCPFPPGPVSTLSVVRCFLRGNVKCLWYVLGLSLLMSVLSCVAPFFTSMVFSEVVPNADRALLGQIAILSVACALFDCVLQCVHSRNIFRFRFTGCLSLQLALFDRVLRLGVNFFRDYRPAELASRLTSCVESMNKFGSATLKCASNLILLVAPTAMLFYYSSALALAAVLVIAVHLAVDILMYVRVMRLKGVMFAQSGRLTGLVERFVRGAGKIRAAGAENSVFRLWAHDFAEVQASYRASAVWWLGLKVLMSLLSISLFLVTAGVVVYAYLHQVGGGAISLADFAGFTAALSFVSATALWILWNVDTILRALPSFRWVKPILDAAEDPAETSLGLDAETYRGGIELDHVSFAYPGGRQILDDVSLKADPGEFIALTGESGAGKSTALRIMLRFERPDGGSVLYDGKDIAGCDMKPLRARFGVVMQTAATMPDTIFRNIVGYGSGAHTEEEVWEAARLAGCADAIRDFPQGLQTVLSEGSVSGGQRQRFLLAQAFLRRPRIFFLDEATSALDNATQKIVVDSLARMKATRVVIAHRLSTIRDADRIYFLDHGRIAEVGTYDELMAKDGLFARAARRQTVEGSKT